ncbi:metallophosphoesterase [Paenibacillus sp. y28]|uniref:metallophosphoesterase n=1 Tax=Paenibacillus sp. y28 TaxID=3129110 RepID=UPI003018F189
MSNLSRSMTRRSFLKHGFGLAAGLFATGGSTYAYSRFIEPGWIEIARMELACPRLPEAFNGVRLLHFSDLHIGFHFDMKDLQSVVGQINSLKPDLVCFTGDLYDYALSSNEECGQHLSAIQAPLGKFAVFGNHDYYKDYRKIAAIFQAGDFTLLKNSSTRVEYQDHMMQVAGVDDMWSGKPNLAKALDALNPDAFTLLLSHAPDFADIAAESYVDVQLSGHSHGGQVRLPGLGAVVTPDFGRKYVMGLYKLNNNRLQVYTNRGIGCSNLPIRLFCRPELTLITLRSAPS